MKKITKSKIKKELKGLWRDRQLILMILPALTILIMFCYVPMGGLVLAFKRFNYSLGMFDSPWCGFENFKILFANKDVFWRSTRNTLMYYVLLTATNTVGCVMLAIGLNELAFKRCAKVMQSIMILPTFMSYVAVTMIVTSLLDYKVGMLNHLIEALGNSRINFYIEAKWWPLILTIVDNWKGLGYGSVIYLSTLSGIDQGLYESAEIDGANGWQKMWYITIPHLMPMVSVMTILSLGNIMESNIGLFYRVTKNVGALYPTTQTLSSYVYDAVRNTTTTYGNTSAITFYQSIVALVMVVAVNLIVRKKSPDHALF